MIADALSIWWDWITAGLLSTIALAAVVWIIDRVATYRIWPQLLFTLWLLVLLRPLVSDSVTVPAPVSVAPEILTSPLASSAAISFPVVVVLMLIWVTGVITLVAACAVRYRRQLYAITAQNVPPELTQLAKQVSKQLALRSVPRLVVSDKVPGAFVTGLVNPIVVVPADILCEKERHQLTHVLAHEFAHLKRRDHYFAAAELAIAILFWFNPVVWIALRRLKHLREVCCDRHVCLALGEKRAYRSTLAGRAALILKSRPPSLAFGGGASITMRLRWLMLPLARPRCYHHAVTVAAAIFVFGVFLPAAAKRLGPYEITTVSGETIDYSQLQGSLQKKYAVFAAQPEPQPTEEQ